MMTREECLIELDDLWMRAWECRDVIAKAARNESWGLIHDAPKSMVKVAVDMAYASCQAYTELMLTAEDAVETNAATNYEEIVDGLEALLAANISKYNRMMEMFGGHEIKHTHNARYRKSYIRD